MRANRKYTFSFGNKNYNKILSKEDKFNLVSCPMKESFCKNVLAEINELYRESEFAYINKEYLIMVELLQEAYNKTLELNESSCSKCVHLFQSSINQTLETLKEELPKMSHSFYITKKLPTC